jgi:YVTN family beta-propeller protein
MRLSRFRLLAVLIPISLFAFTTGSYAVRQRWKVNSEGSWNALACDSAAHRLFLTRGDRVLVLDSATGAQVGAVNGLEDSLGLNLQPGSHRGYVTDGAASKLVVFDTQTLQTVATVPTGLHPSGVAVDSGTATVSVLNDQDQSISFFDSRSNTALGTLQLSGQASGAAVIRSGFLAITLRETGEIANVDLAKRQVKATFHIPNCVGPAALVADSKGQRLYTACENGKLVVLDASSFRVLTTAPVPTGTRALALDEKQGVLFASDAGGLLTLLHAAPGSLVKLQSLKTMPGARNVAVDPGTGRAYLASAEFGQRTGEISEELRFRPTPVPNTFTVLVVAR